ncbi:MAG: hypothetical protein J6Y93_01555 [Treponema sp.]|nr:hypothetical protein [Treponema sp.]
MATTTSIIVLLKFFAGKQNSGAVDYNEFCDYLKKYSEHHLEEQPSLVVYLQDLAGSLKKELDKLTVSRQTLLLSKGADKQMIIVVPFYIEKFAHRYKEILLTPQLPFPSELDLPKQVPNEIVTRVQASDLIPKLLEKETLDDKTLYGLTLPHDSPSILLPSSVSIMTLTESALMKIRTMLLKEEHHDYFLKKVQVSNPGKEISAKTFFKRLVDSQESAMKMVVSPEDSFYYWSQLCFFIKKDYEKVKDFTQEDISLLQSVYTIEIILAYYKSKVQANQQKESALRTLETLLAKPPYYYDFDAICKFTNNGGVPLLGQYSEENLKDFLHAKTSEAPAGELPELLVFKTEHDHRYFIYKRKVFQLIFRLCQDARITITETMKKRWFSVLKNYDNLPEMNDQNAFERSLENEVRVQSPILYSLLNSSFLSLVHYEANNDNDGAITAIALFEDGRLLPYSEILLINKNKLMTDTKILLPFWYTTPVISWFAKLFFRPPKSKKPKKQKTSAQIYHEEEAEIQKEEKEAATYTKNQNLSRKLALREAARNAEASLVPSSSTLNRELDSYEQQWNKLIGKETHKNLTDDVNSLIRDYMRKVLRTLKATGFTPERIHSLAESLVKTPGMQKINDTDSLMMYVQLYMVKLVKNIPV